MMSSSNLLCFSCTKASTKAQNILSTMSGEQAHNIIRQIFTTFYRKKITIESLLQLKVISVPNNVVTFFSEGRARAMVCKQQC